MFKYIKDEDIANLNIDSATLVDWVDECLRNKSSYDLPPKISIKKEGHIFYNIMPAILENHNLAGVKVVNRYPNRIPTLDSKILLYDYTNGQLKYVVDGDTITAIRTGAVAVHSVKLLAKEDIDTISLIGLGKMMYSTAKILFDIYSNKELTVKLYRYKNQAELFVQAFSHFKNLKFEIFDTYQEVMSNSDVIISAITYAQQDFCDEKYYKKGCLIVPIHTLGFQNCDLVFDKVYGDDYGHIKDFKYFNKFKQFNEVAEVLKNKSLGRSNNEERILAYNIGLAIHDIFFAQKILNLIENQK